jgi:hypothetical protein
MQCLTPCSHTKKLRYVIWVTYFILAYKFELWTPPKFSNLDLFMLIILCHAWERRTGSYIYGFSYCPCCPCTLVVLVGHDAFQWFFYSLPNWWQVNGRHVENWNIYCWGRNILSPTPKDQIMTLRTFFRQLLPMECSAWVKNRWIPYWHI